MLARGTRRLRHTGSVATAMATPAKKALMQQNIRMSSTLVMTPSCKTMGATRLLVGSAWLCFMTDNECTRG